jgi:hypothetical protein
MSAHHKVIRIQKDHRGCDERRTTVEVMDLLTVSTLAERVRASRRFETVVRDAPSCERRGFRRGVSHHPTFDRNGPIAFLSHARAFIEDRQLGHQHSG